jgi:hypothetical protein
MTLPEEARERLADIVELQPTKNAELQDRWGLASGSDVHQYLESELDEYYYRNADSLICATPKAEARLGDGDVDGLRTVSGSTLDRQVTAALPGPDGEPQSVVATLHDIRGEAHDPDVDAVRSSLHALVDRGLVDRVQRAVPTFRLALDIDRIEIEVESDEE